MNKERASLELKITFENGRNEAIILKPTNQIQLNNEHMNNNG